MTNTALLGHLHCRDAAQQRKGNVSVLYFFFVSTTCWQFFLMFFPTRTWFLKQNLSREIVTLSNFLQIVIKCGSSKAEIFWDGTDPYQNVWSAGLMNIFKFVFMASTTIICYLQFRCHISPAIKMHQADWFARTRQPGKSKAGVCLTDISKFIWGMEKVTWQWLIHYRF